jgi:hypothetical protein
MAKGKVHAFWILICNEADLFCADSKIEELKQGDPCSRSSDDVQPGVGGGEAARQAADDSVKF